MLLTAIVFIILALILYSLSIWSERLSRKLKLWMVIVFSSAFTCDLTGTSMMFFRATEKFQANIHSCCGYAALIIMGLHLVWGIYSLRSRGRAEIYFHRFSIFAWMIWLAAFISGVPKM